MTTNVWEDLKARGFVYQSTDEKALEKVLADGPVTYYVGFDPTGDSLHVGHLLPVMCMRWLQKAGHHPIALVGGATGLVGDPSGKQEARPILTKEKVAQNCEAIGKQLRRFLPYDNVIMANNIDWLGEMKYLDFLRDIGSKFSVNKMLTAESVKLRMETGITFMEFSYMLLQSYDYYILNRDYGCTLECGGQDQWGNIAAGIDLVRRLSQKEVHGFTMPLLLNSQGKKFGKSVGGAVWLDKNKTSVFDYYQFWRNVDDNDVKKLMGYFTALPLDEIASLCAASINRAKEILAFEATSLAHGHEEAAKAYLAACTKFGFADRDAAIPTSSRIREVKADSAAALNDLPTYRLQLPAEGVWIVKLLADSGLCKSNGDARRLVQGGGAYLGEKRIDKVDYTVTAADFTDGSVILKAGKKNIKRIVVE